ncbi:MAG: hypothetical protein KR126chlam6_00762 [Candidatus Anoxychlamydiales bacterium]|nr:hypothetical protein [Candidatus Anoxychlamydiales bacterium]
MSAIASPADSKKVNNSNLSDSTLNDVDASAAKKINSWTVVSAVFFTIGLAASSIATLGFNHIIIQASISTLNMILGTAVISTALSVVSFFLSFIGSGGNDKRSSSHENEAAKPQDSASTLSSTSHSKKLKDNIDAALRNAAGSGDTKKVLALIEKGAKVNRKGWTALMYAARYGHTDTALALIEKGAKIKIDEHVYEETALMWAAENGHTETVLALIEKGSKVNKRNLCGDYTALMYAAKNGHTDTVLALIEKGADIDKKSPYMTTLIYTTALMLAAENGHTKTVLALIEQGAEIDKKDSHSGWTALAYALGKGHIETALALIEKGADGDTQAVKEGITMLIVAAARGYKEIVLALIEKGAELDTQDEDGNTALMWAEKKGNTDIVDILKKAQAQKQKKHLQSTCYKFVLPIIFGFGSYLLYNSRKMNY